MSEPKKIPQIPGYIAPLVLISDVAIAAMFWIFRDALFGPGQETNAAIIAGFLVFSGLVVFMFIRNVSRKVI